MANIPGSVPITGYVAPTDATDLYATHDEAYGRGGYRTVASLAERDAITADRRKAGMLVNVNGQLFLLGAGLSNADWGALELGGTTASGTGGIIDGGLRTEEGAIIDGGTRV
jgi:hypothetical protein